MIEPMKTERVIVNRGFGTPFEADTLHRVREDIVNPKTKDITPGAFIGIAVRDDRSFVLYAQMNQIAPAA